MEALTNKRIYYFDNVKSLLIFFVVIGHFAETAYSLSDTYKSMFIWLYLFHMPLFIFISGFFSKNLVKSKERVLRKSFEFYTLYLIMKATFFLGKFVIEPKSASFNLLTESSVPWYLFAMASMYLISYLTRNVNPKAIFLLFLGAALLVGYDSEIKDYLVMSRTIVFYPFFLLGLNCNDKIIYNLKDNKKIKIAAVAILLISFIVCFSLPDIVCQIRGLLTARNPYKSLVDHLKLYGPFLRCMVYVLGFLMGASVLVLVPKRKLGYFTKIGANTMPIYFFHRQIIRFLTSFGIYEILTKIVGTALSDIAWLLIAVILTLILSLDIFNKPFKWWSNFLFKKVKD